MGKLSKDFLIRKKIDLYIVMFGIFLSFLTPGTVTWDGYLYEGSAFSLFSKTMATNYHWLREPGFPGLFRVTYNIGGFRAFVLAQTILLSLSIIFFRRTLLSVFPVGKKAENIFNLSCVLSLWIGISYATSVLQQILFTFFISLICFIGSQNIEQKKLVLVGTLIGIGVGLTSSILFVGVVIGLLLIALLNRILTRTKWSTWILLGAIFVSGGATTASWYSYKSTQPQNLRIYKDAWNFWEAATCRINLTGSKSKIANSIETIFEIPSTIASVNSLGIEYCQGTLASVGGEEITFATPRYSSSTQLCGRAFPGPEKYLSVVNPNVKMYCVPKLAVNILNPLRFILAGLIPMIAWLGFFGTIMASRKKEFWDRSGVLLLPLFCEVPYWSSSGAGSRYGIQMLILSPMLFSVLFLNYRARRSKISWIMKTK